MKNSSYYLFLLEFPFFLFKVSPTSRTQLLRHLMMKLAIRYPGEVVNVPAERAFER